MSNVYRLLAQCLKKKRYPSIFFAEKVAKRCMAERGGSLRAYYCSNCAGYHLTSQKEGQ